MYRYKVHIHVLKLDYGTLRSVHRPHKFVHTSHMKSADEEL